MRVLYIYINHIKSFRAALPHIAPFAFVSKCSKFQKLNILVPLNLSKPMPAQNPPTHLPRSNLQHHPYIYAPTPSTPTRLIPCTHCKTRGKRKTKREERKRKMMKNRVYKRVYHGSKDLLQELIVENKREGKKKEKKRKRENNLFKRQNLSKRINKGYV